MSNSRPLSDEHGDLVLRLDRLQRERKRFALTRSVLESTVALSINITETILAEGKLTEELQMFLSVTLGRQATAHRRLAGRAGPEEWLDRLVAHALKLVREEVLT